MNWNLNCFYTDESDYLKDFESLDGLIKEFLTFKGKLNHFDTFKAYILHEEKVTKILYKLYGYAHLSSDLNLKDQALQSRYQKLLIKLNELSSITSFISPEIISIGKEKIFEFLNSDEKLKEYSFPYEKLFRLQEHVLSDKEEKLLSNFSPISNIPTQLYQALSLIDRVDEKVTLSDGNEVTVNTSNWRSLLPNLSDKEDRKLVFEAAFKRYHDNKEAFASTYNLVLQNMKSHYKSRGYNNALESRLNQNNIPIDVFLTLKDTVYESTEPVKRYLKLRQQYLKLDTYHTYDRFLTLVDNPKTYTFLEGKELFFKALEGFDKDFANKQKDALEDGYVDVEMKDGKRIGLILVVYMDSIHLSYNHDKTIDSVFTIVHEAGHSAHSLFADEAQPLATHSYTIFVAEIASTFNERVLADYMLKNSTSKKKKDNHYWTWNKWHFIDVLRQTLFATYEYEANKLVELGIL